MPASEPSLGIVIPVYNEAENILETLAAIEAHTPLPVRVWIVGDSEEDTTFTVLEQFNSDKVQVEPLINGYGRGALNAIKWGLHTAPETAILVTMADMSDDMGALDSMWSTFLSGKDVVCGSRYMKGGRQIGGPFLKGLMSRVAGLSLHYLSGLPTKDVTNSFKLYSKEVVDSIKIESAGGFEIGMELVVKAWVLGFQVSEVPSTWRDRTEGDSRFQIWAWLPSYLRWYFYGLRFGVRKRLGLAT